MRSRLLLTSSLAVMACAPLTGCSSDGGGVFGQVLSNPAQDAMALLPESVKQSVEGYLSGLTSVTDLLAGAGGYTDLLGMVPQLRPLIAQVGEASQALAALTPETRGNVVEAFGPRLAETNGMFTSQVDRLRSGMGLPPAVSDLLSGVNLFG